MGVAAGRDEQKILLRLEHDVTGLQIPRNLTAFRPSRLCTKRRDLLGEVLEHYAASEAKRREKPPRYRVLCAVKGRVLCRRAWRASREIGRVIAVGVTSRAARGRAGGGDWG